MYTEQAIQTAIQYETKVRDVYRDAAGKTGDETGRRVLQLLADEEQQHLDFLSEKLREWRQTGKVTPKKLSSVVPSREVVAESLKRLDCKVSGPAGAGELDLLNRALSMEKETSDFYRQMVNELEPAGQALFEPFMDVEDGHLMIVQAEIDNVRGLGYWFDFREFDLEAG
jgi:rubrerythrin